MKNRIERITKTLSVALSSRAQAPFFAGLLVALALGATGCGDAVGKMNDGALESLAAGNFGAAEQTLKDAIVLRPTNRTLRRNLIEVYFRQEKWDEAIRQIKSTREIAGLESDLELRTSEVLAQIMADRPKFASVTLRELIEEDPDNEYLLFLTGLTATSPKRAIQSLDRAIELNPDRRESYFALIRAHNFAGDSEAARETLAAAIEKFGESSETALHEISLCFAENDTERARETLKGLDPDYRGSPQARLFEAYLAISDRDIEGAQVLFESLAEEPEIRDRAKLGMALCWLNQGEVVPAIEVCEEILKDDPGSATAYNLMGLGNLKRLQRFRAKQNLLTSLENNPDQPAIRALVDRLSSL